MNKLLLFTTLICLSFTYQDTKHNQYFDKGITTTISADTSLQKWVWVGTSIPAMYGVNSYPTQFAKKMTDNGFNINLVNQSLSSSLVIWGSKLALSATRAELTAKWPGSENNSYETKIIAEHPDVLIIDHGYNDRDSIATHLGDINSTDRTTFYGAYNYILKYAYGQNQNLRIAIIIPPNNVRWATQSAQVKKLNAMRDALLVLASRYGCIVVDLMKCMGYNDYTYPKLTIDDTHMQQTTANYAAAILYDKLKILAFDHLKDVPRPLPISFKWNILQLPIFKQVS